MIKDTNKGITNFFINCHLCKQPTAYYGFTNPVIFKLTKERVLVCNTCFDQAIKKNESDYRIIKNDNLNKNEK
jgi:hypothetical protein